jgi:alpha-tubulin suppressor-like RCC1 family protein
VIVLLVMTRSLDYHAVLYVCGSGDACGQGERWANEDFREVLSLTGIEIRRIFANDEHSIAIDENGRVFACGLNWCGKCGLGEVEKVSAFERLTIFDEHPVILASPGYEFTAFVTENLELYTCGCGGLHQLCNSNNDNVRSPSLAELTQGKSVMSVSCGDDYIAIAENLERIPKHPGRAHFGLD